MKTSTTTSDRFVGYQESLDSIKGSFSGPLSGILKYYEKDVNTVMNISFFEKGSRNINQQDIDNIQTFLSLSLARSIVLEKDIENDGLLNTAQKNFLLHTLRHIQLGLKMLEYTVYIEANKGGYNLSDTDKEKYLIEIEKYETLLYGPSIHAIPGESRSVLNHIGDLYMSNGSLLSHQEQATIKDFFLTHNFSPKKGGGEKKEKKENNSVLNKQISSDTLRQILEKVYNIYGEDIVSIYESSEAESPTFDKENNRYIIPTGIHSKDLKEFYHEYMIAEKTKVIMSDIATNFSVGRRKDEYFDDHTIKFPANNNYEIKRVCELIDHEVGTHFVRNKNSSLGVDIKSGGYLETEEGIATANEQLASGDRENLAADEPTIHHLSTFIAEKYDAGMTKKILEILFVLQGEDREKSKKLAHDRMLRVKRFHAFDLPGANRKDVVYWRGMKNVVEYLQNTDIAKLKKDTKLLYSGKFSDKDMDYIDGLFDGLDIDTDKYISPLALGKMICHKYTGNNVNKKTLAQQDLRFDSPLTELNYTQKKKLIEILDILQKD